MPGFTSEAFTQRWRQLTLMEQLGNIGSEVERTISWKNKGNDDLSNRAFHRSLDLLDLTIGDTRWHDGRLKELTRIREIICDAFLGDNQYNATPEFLGKYFLAFAVGAQRAKEKQASSMQQPQRAARGR